MKILSIIKRIAFCLGMEDIALLPHLCFSNPRVYIIWMNGECIGVHSDVDKFVRSLRCLRRHGKISPFASIYVNKKHRDVMIATDQGRVCRPLIIVDKKTGKSLLRDEHLRALECGLMCFTDLVNAGIIEYLDVNE
eukprot:256756_1